MIVLNLPIGRIIMNKWVNRKVKKAALHVLLQEIRQLKETQDNDKVKTYFNPFNLPLELDISKIRKNTYDFIEKYIEKLIKTL